MPRKARAWPEWGWEFILSPHIGRWQEDRGFTEVELRRMLEHADGFEPDAMVGRWRIRALPASALSRAPDVKATSRGRR